MREAARRYAAFLAVVGIYPGGAAPGGTDRGARLYRDAGSRQQYSEFPFA